MSKLLLLTLCLVGCEANYTEDNPCPHTIYNYDSYRGYCWCDIKSCRPSEYIPKENK